GAIRRRRREIEQLGARFSGELRHVADERRVVVATGDQDLATSSARRGRPERCGERKPACQQAGGPEERRRQEITALHLTLRWRESGLPPHERPRRNQ